MKKVFDKKTIVKILEDLSDKRPVFCSEADFQFELAYFIKNYLIKENYKDVEVLLEYYQLYNSKGNPMYIDILIIIDGNWYPVELKYKIKGNYDKNKPLRYIDNRYEFVLKSHLAQDISCYKYLYDIKRIEEVRSNVPQFKKGYAIMLTNDSCYWKGPKNNDCIYSEFLINGTKPKEKDLNWKKGTSEGTKKGCEEPIKFEDEYTMVWSTYSKIPTNKLRGYKGRDINSICEFKYVISEINAKNN